MDTLDTANLFNIMFTIADCVGFAIEYRVFVTTASYSIIYIFLKAKMNDSFEAILFMPKEYPRLTSMTHRYA